jgi:hypothetical protein
VDLEAVRYDERDEGDDGTGRPLFPTLVDLLERHDHIERLGFLNATFSGDDEDDAVRRGASPRPKDLERLFGSVLPARPSIK